MSPGPRDEGAAGDGDASEDALDGVVDDVEVEGDLVPKHRVVETAATERGACRQIGRRTVPARIAAAAAAAAVAEADEADETRARGRSIIIAIY
jgi:hypothetical protein